MELISGILSNNAAKVRLVLGEKGIDYHVIEVLWTKENAWEPKPALLLEKNPRGEVPVLMDGDLTLWDSTVIAEYLEDKYPLVPLMPADLVSKAECRLWEDEGDQNQLHVGVLIRDVFLGEPGGVLTDEATNALAALTEFYRRCDQRLKGRDYLCDAFSVADISVFMIVVFSTTLGSQLEGEHLMAWFERMNARPVVKAEVEAILGVVAGL